ncbi:MAG: UDP-glucose/GDP-mannose dehydrogenase family protein [Mariprofundaceae bacterium]|nr:UDP-glucose/GDP-mannose dehydrogenase family protein [Mariprofundaceae bacterium]
MSNPTIGFCGMTHLGLNSAISGASKGFPMICFDADHDLIARLNQGELPVVEPQLDELLAEHRANITFTSDLADLQKCDVAYVAPDVPTDDQGKSDLSGIYALLDIVEPALRADAVLVVLSQVNPGFTRELGRAAGPLYYQVETLIFGRAVERALYPERYIIGCEDPNEPLPDVYKAFLEAHDCPILPMRYESAELAKISINMCLVASVSVANTMAEICENIGADWSEIVPSLRLDRRIGQYSYIVPGLGISGGNLERDLASVIRMGDEHGTDAGVVRAWIDNSQHRKGWPFRTLDKVVLQDNPDAKVSILGLAYKENTHSTKNSPALVLLNSLGDKKATVFDPIVSADQGGENTIGAASALEAAKGADVVMIMTPWPEFKDITAAQLAEAMSGNILIDPYRIIDPEDAMAHGLDHITLGVTA